MVDLPPPYKPPIHYVYPSFVRGRELQTVLHNEPSSTRICLRDFPASASVLGNWGGQPQHADFLRGQSHGQRP